MSAHNPPLSAGNPSPDPSPTRPSTLPYSPEILEAKVHILLDLIELNSDPLPLETLLSHLTARHFTAALTNSLITTEEILVSHLIELTFLLTPPEPDSELPLLDRVYETLKSISRTLLNYCETVVAEETEELTQGGESKETKTEFQGLSSQPGENI